MTFVIPFRNRSEHLAQFLKHYRKLFPQAYFLVVEQSVKGKFNKGALFNAGAKEHEADYYILHDVDMLVQGPCDYSFPDNPTHCATGASQFQWKMPFEEYFGGVVLINREQYINSNGFTNRFWGWSAEDDEFRHNLLTQGYTLDTREHRYLSLPHPRSHPTGYDPDKWVEAHSPRPEGDGYSGVQYVIIKELQFPQGRKITVEI